MRNFILLCAVVLSACTVQPVESTAAPSPAVHSTQTPSPSPTADVKIVQATAIPTSTPFLYVVQSGDTISGLAEKFKITQDQLSAANPDASPNSLTIGMTLIIPDPSAVPSGASTPTPVQVPVTQTVCHSAAEGGQRCFALIENNSGGLLGNISVRFSLLDQNETEIASQTEYGILDMIQPGTSLPIYTFFPSESPAGAHIQVQVLSANQVSSSSPAAEIQNSSARINGNTARLNGKVFLPPDSLPASQVWVAAAAYDRDGRVVGLKRWEGGALQPGGMLPFDFSISSLAGGIERVQFLVQARP